MAFNGLRRRRNTGATENNANTMTADEYATRRNLYGPISHQLLVDPVRIKFGEELDDGKAYERIKITRWLNDRGTSPTTRNRATVANLVPADDIQQEITELVRRYPNAPIVRDWLQQQPAWYTLAIQRIRNTAAPVVRAMSRAMPEPVRQVMPSADTCIRCCAKTAEVGAGAVVGAGVGACAGCSCVLLAQGEAEESGHSISDEEKAAAAAFLTPTGAAIGALVGAVLGPEECLKCAGEACSAACEPAGKNYGGGKRKRKTRKGKRKKRRKTRKRKRKRKQTIKKKRRRGRKSRKRTRRRKKH